MIFSDLFSQGQYLPLLLDGKTIKTGAERKVVESFWERTRLEYGAANVETFRQLPKERRTLIVDDWHATGLNAEGRRAFLDVAARYFGKIILFTDDLFRMQELADKFSETMTEFEHLTIQDFSHLTRGTLIDRWLTLGREHTTGST